MDDTARLACPYCGELVDIYVEADVHGVLVQDCEVCCQPWELRVTGHGPDRQVDIRRADGND